MTAAQVRRAGKGIVGYGKGGGEGKGEKKEWGAKGRFKGSLSNTYDKKEK